MSSVWTGSSSTGIELQTNLESLLSCILWSGWSTYHIEAILCPKVLNTCTLNKGVKITAAFKVHVGDISVIERNSKRKWCYDKNIGNLISDRVAYVILLILLAFPQYQLFSVICVWGTKSDEGNMRSIRTNGVNTSSPRNNIIKVKSISFNTSICIILWMKHTLTVSP